MFPIKTKTKQSALVIPRFVAAGEDEKNEVKRICAGYDARFNVRFDIGSSRVTWCVMFGN